uniref:Uncharacterized protein n=1 Tax=viral metagenome TaxID=1070528 RepID=A0A6C0BRI3_9ZZZZ
MYIEIWIYIDLVCLLFQEGSNELDARIESINSIDETSTGVIWCDLV